MTKCPAVHLLMVKERMGVGLRQITTLLLVLCMILVGLLGFKQRVIEYVSRFGLTEYCFLAVTDLQERALSARAIESVRDNAL